VERRERGTRHEMAQAQSALLTLTKGEGGKKRVALKQGNTPATGFSRGLSEAKEQGVDVMGIRMTQAGLSHQPKTLIGEKGSVASRKMKLIITRMGHRGNGKRKCIVSFPPLGGKGDIAVKYIVGTAADEKQHCKYQR